MRKFTLYQAARFTKISRYKLEQAIREGILKTVDGKGNIKCYIYEEELNKFLEDHGDQFVKFSFEDDKSNTNSDLSDYIHKDLHEKIVMEKERVIRILELQQETLLPLISSSKQAPKTSSSAVENIEEALNLALEYVPSKDKDKILKLIPANS